MGNIRRAVVVTLSAWIIASLHAFIDESMREMGKDALAVSQLDLGNGVELSKEQIERFHKDGYLMVKGVIPEKTVKVLFANRPRSMFPVYLKPVEWLFCLLSSSKISIDAIWAENALFRRFWFQGPVPRIVSQLMKDKPVRLLTDIVYGIPRGSRPRFLGKWHKDSTSFDIVDRKTANGLSAWIPLVNIDAERFGGSIYMGNKSIVSRQCQAEPDDDCSEPCMEHLDQVASVYNFQRGDVLFFHDDTFHRSQPLQAESMESDRFSLVGRFVQGDAVFAQSLSPEKQRKNFCDHNLTVGQKIHSPCFPQVYPPQEDARFKSLQYPSFAEQIIGNLIDIISGNTK